MRSNWYRCRSRQEERLPFGCLALIVLFGLVSWLTVSALEFIGPVGATVVTLAVLLLWLWFVISQRRKQNWADTGLCENCGYDVRCNADRCPECGNTVHEELRRMRRIRDHMKKMTTRSSPMEGELHDEPSGQEPYNPDN